MTRSSGDKEGRRIPGVRMIRSRWIPVGRRFACMNLFGLLFVKPWANPSATLINHERIHSVQMRELLWIPFYILYVLEWLWWLIRWRGDTYRAYHSISFEREAYAYGDDLDYIPRRRRFAQWRKE